MFTLHIDNLAAVRYTLIALRYVRCFSQLSVNKRRHQSEMIDLISKSQCHYEQYCRL